MGSPCWDTFCNCLVLSPDNGEGRGLLFFFVCFFFEEETKAQRERVKVTCPRSHSEEWPEQAGSRPRPCPGGRGESCDGSHSRPGMRGLEGPLSFPFVTGPQLPYLPVLLGGAVTPAVVLTAG